MPLPHARQSVAVVALLLVCLCLGHAQELPPTPKHYLNDYAGVTSEATQHDLNTRLAKFDQETNNQVVVAIFPAMDSALSLDEYTLRLAKAWGVGQRGKNNGVTLFVFVQNHTVRIQVGYGLTGVLTDELAKQILDVDLKPHFRVKDFDGGLTKAVDSMLAIIAGTPQPSATPTK